MAFRAVLRREDLWRGEKIGIRVGRVPVLLVDLDGEVKAYEDRCRHQAVPLSEGRLDGTHLTCRAHEWVYDARTGKGLNPEGVALRAFGVKIEDGQIFVDVGEDER